MRLGFGFGVTLLDAVVKMQSDAITARDLVLPCIKPLSISTRLL